ncbi:hypothetical protein BDN70DRAFT_908479 [Pholiota conissans]|uniref:Uncharacterized protein n=1 Tax=Pholiota conissans TaxID=109636 RepID=A0A9P5YS60_9AGAR|nr:hypothetical protein BDN70DRAFT_908479 [Pholiota conissans]
MSMQMHTRSKLITQYKKVSPIIALTMMLITVHWNNYWNIYISHQNLPWKFLQQEFHTYFVSTSLAASITKQFHSIKQVIDSMHKKLVKVHHGALGKQIYPEDNPAQSEVCGHIGRKGNQFCRKCHVGETHKIKESDEGFHSLFKPGSACCAEEIALDVKKQVILACLGVAQNVQNYQAKTGIKDKLLAWMQEHENEIYNPFLKLARFDATINTPVEILHTILLRIIKYLQKQMYSVCLQSTAMTGLSIHAIQVNYIMQYANLLIGQQFKTIAQVNVFHVYDLVDPTWFLLTKAVEELSALLWMLEIPNMEEYLVYL